MNKQTEALKMLQEARANFNIISGIVSEYTYMSGQQNMQNHYADKHRELNIAIDRLLECLNEQTN